MLAPVQFNKTLPPCNLAVSTNMELFGIYLKFGLVNIDYLIAQFPVSSVPIQFC